MSPTESVNVADAVCVEPIVLAEPCKFRTDSASVKLEPFTYIAAIEYSPSLPAVVL